jgi:hypothetical protein
MKVEGLGFTKFGTEVTPFFTKAASRVPVLTVRSDPSVEEDTCSFSASLGSSSGRGTVNVELR